MNHSANMSAPLVVANLQIRRDAEGRYCLNDLHHAAGGEQRHRPKYWLENAQTQELLAEMGKGGIPPLDVIHGGVAPGTYVVKELVYAYAMWISPRFHIEVIRAYDALVTGRETGTTSAVASLHRARAAIVSRLYRARHPAEQRALLDQATRLSLELGLPAPEAPDAVSPAVQRTLEEFWSVVDALLAEGRPLNHSRRSHLLALSLPEVAVAALALGYRWPERGKLLTALRSSTAPRFIGAKVVNSIVHRRGVKCWVFRMEGEA